MKFPPDNKILAHSIITYIV